MRNLDGNVLLIDGHIDRHVARGEAREFMVAAGMDPVLVDDLLVDRPHLIARAWWSDEPGRGFVQEHHDDGQPVTVIHVEVPQ